MPEKDQTTPRKTVICYSGGLDSTALLYKLLAAGDEVTAVNFYYGAKQNSQERAQARLICREVGVTLHELELPFVQTLFTSALLQGGAALPQGASDKSALSKTVVPGRNGIFLSILAGFAESIGAQRIALANHAGDHYVYPDCRPEWIAAISLTVFLGSEGKVSIYAPFTHLTKGELCRLAADLKAPLGDTWSCYDGRPQHCGNCSTCLARRQAFAEAGLKDPTTYLA